MEHSNQTVSEGTRFRNWFKDLEDKHQTDWVYSLSYHVWQNMTYREFEFWFDRNSQDLYRRAAELEHSEVSGLDTSGLVPFTPPGLLPAGFQQIWDTEPLSVSTKENWKLIRLVANTTSFHHLISDNAQYRTRFEALQDLHIREYYAAKGQRVPEHHLEGDWLDFFNRLPPRAATTEIMNEMINTSKRTRHVPPDAWWAMINPGPTTTDEFVNALCRRFLAEFHHYEASQELYPFRHSTYLGIRLPNRWRDWWANSDPKYRTSYIWCYSMANLDRAPQDIMQGLRNNLDLRPLRPGEEVEQPDDDDIGNAPHQPSTYGQSFGSRHGEQGYGRAGYGTGDSTPFHSTPYESTGYDSTPYGSTPFIQSPVPLQGTFQTPSPQHQPPKGYSCLSNSAADAAPGNIEPDPNERAARIYNSTKKPRLIGISGRPVQGIANYGWWGKYVDDGPQKPDETVEKYIERVNRARDNMRIQLRLRPNPPVRHADESIEQHRQRLNTFNNNLKWNETAHNNRMDDEHPQFDRAYREWFQQTARSVHAENEARRAAARNYWDTEVARLHSTGGHRQLKTLALYRKRYRNNEAIEANIWNLYEGWTDEDMRKGEWPPSPDEVDNAEGDDEVDDDVPRVALIKCAQCYKSRVQCSGIQYGTPTWNVWPCERCKTFAGGKVKDACGPRYSKAVQMTNKRQKVKNSSTRGPYLVSWWASELPDVPRGPPPPDHWAVRIQETFKDIPRPATPETAPTPQQTLLPPPQQARDDRGTVTPSGAESGSTAATSKGGRPWRSDRGRKHRYPTNRRQPRKPKQSEPTSRAISRSRSASPAKDAHGRSYKSRSPIRSTRRCCQRCIKKNRVCSAQNIQERPCKECVNEGLDAAHICSGKTAGRSASVSEYGNYGSEGGGRGGMDPGSPSGYNSHPGQRGGDPSGYDCSGSFDDFQPYGQPYSST